MEKREKTLRGVLRSADIGTAGRKHSNKTAVRWILYMAAAWLVASLGVNGTASPLHYLESIRMKEQKLLVEAQPDGIFIMFPQERKMDWLAFWLDGADLYFYDAVLYGITDSGEEERLLPITKGRNTVRLPDSWKGIRIPKELSADGQLSIETAYLTEYEKLSAAKTLYLTASFLLMFGFWECVQWVKQRYAG